MYPLLLLVRKISVSTKMFKSFQRGLGQRDVWPPSCPEFKSMDFVIWSILECDVSAKFYSRVAALQNALLTSWSASDEEVIRSSCNQLPVIWSLWSMQSNHFQM